jgi:hypothetical protein
MVIQTKKTTGRLSCIFSFWCPYWQLCFSQKCLIPYWRSRSHERHEYPSQYDHIGAEDWGTVQEVCLNHISGSIIIIRKGRKLLIIIRWWRRCIFNVLRELQPPHRRSRWKWRMVLRRILKCRPAYSGIFFEKFIKPCSPVRSVLTNAESFAL